MMNKIKFYLLAVMLFMGSLASGAQQPTLLPEPGDQTPAEPQSPTIVYVIVVIVVGLIVYIAWQTTMRKRKNNIRNKR